MDRALKNIAIYVLIVLIALFAIKLTSAPPEEVKELSFPQLYSKVQQGQVEKASVEIDDLVYNISGTLKSGEKFTANAPKDSQVDIIKAMQEAGVDYDTPPVPPPPWWTSLFSTLLPIIILI
ncbi:MAG TPA: cell division protein FtsH, partial [Syntrophomonas sp.]|nr:cell division protein FtsH [Syntrophomonas sp.]